MTLVIGTAGHIDHGKTTLLRALTGIDADRLPEERRRGMTIDVGYAHVTLPDGTELDFVDVPGHDRLVGNMLVGAGEVDAAMLVVAADDGPRAQTIEHLALLDALAVSHGLAVVTKADIAGMERTRAVVAEVARLLAGTSLDGSHVLVVSSLDGRGIDELLIELAELRDRVAASGAAGASDAAGVAGGPGASGGSRLAIDRVFTVKGRGAVVTGTLRGAPLARGATMRLVPGGGSVRVREVQIHGAAVEVAAAGRTAVNLAGVDSLDLHRGLVLTTDSAIVATDRVLVRLTAPLADRARARVHVGTAATDGIIGRSGRDALDLEVGGWGAILRLSTPLAVAAGDRLVLRRTSGSARIVGGVVLDVMPPRGISRRRQSGERVGRLAAAVAEGDRVRIAMARLELHGALEVIADVGVGVGAEVGVGVARGVGVAVAVAGSGATRVEVASDVVEIVDAAVLAAVRATALAAPDDSTTLSAVRAVAARSLRRSATMSSTAAATAAGALVDRLVAGGRLVRDGAIVGLPGSRAGSAEVDPALAAGMDRLERALAVPAPPALSDAARSAGCSPAGIRELERSGRIVVLEPDLAYAIPTYRAIVAQALSIASDAPLTPAAFRDATGTSRKYVMAILTDLDRRGVLRRTPEGHVPGPRADLAGQVSAAVHPLTAGPATAAPMTSGRPDG